jgi:AraC family transcriptional regulator
MSKNFSSISQYHQLDDCVSTTKMDVGGVLLAEMVEEPNDISIDAVERHSVLLSLSGSDCHSVRIGDVVRNGPTRPGDISLIPAGIPLRSAWKTTGYALRSFTLEFDTSLFLSLCPEIYSERFAKGSLLAGNYRQYSEIHSLIILMRREMDPSARMGKLFSDSVARLLAFELAAKAWSVPTTVQSHGTQHDKRVTAALDFIEANFHEDISLREIAIAAGMSPTRLTTRFRAQVGQNPYGFVIEKRVTEATRLLRTTDMPIVQVALASGFADQQHLTRVIRARRGETPRAIRLSA